MFEWYISKTKQNLKNAYHSFNPCFPICTTALDRNAGNGIKYWSAVSRLTPKLPMFCYAEATPKLTSAKGSSSFQGSNLLLNKYKFKECKSALFKCTQYSQVLEIFKILEIKRVTLKFFWLAF